MASGGYGTAAEQYVIERVSQLAGWSAVDANSVRAAAASELTRRRVRIHRHDGAAALADLPGWGMHGRDACAGAPPAIPGRSGATAGFLELASEVSRGLLEAMGARENWTLLERPDPADLPPVTDQFCARARGDAPAPRD
jgi:hypothetical protein